jgi:hypothetical protein
MLYTASELGGAARIAGVSLNVSNVRTGGETLTNWTIRLKHTGVTNLVSGAAWDNAGWTTVYRASPTVSATGWMSFKFTTPFDYNGTSNLLVDFSMDRTTSNASFTSVQASSTAQTMAIYGTSNSTNGDPLAWSGITPYPGSYYQRADIRLATIKELPIRPQQTSAFSSGVWSGQISIPVAGNALMLQARAGAVSGASNSFDVANAPVSPTGGATVFADDFESGTLDPAYWTVTGTGNFRTQVTTYLPHGGTRHMAMDEALDSGSYARNEATLILNLAGRTGVVLKFWAAQFGEEPDGPPTSPFPSTGANFDGVAISADGGNNWYEVQPLRTLTGSYTQFTVDLDAALVSRGLSYSSNFKIRFNQYDNYSLGTDGIGIDDIAVTANPLAGFTFTAPSQVNEGAGSVSASVTLDSVPATDTVVALTSSAPAKITVPSSVTIPAGQTNATFVMTVLEDTIVDGNRTIAITGSLPSQLPRSALITVLDNDIFSITVSAPATVAEGVTGVTGSVTMSGVASGPITIGLRSSDTTAIQVPANVTLSAGQRTASFPIAVVDDTTIDGTQVATITASVPGWVDATATVQVTDNEAGNLTISGPYSVTEGSTATGTIYIAGTLQTNLIVTLNSSNPTQLSVPASVTIPAGQTGVSFVATGVEDPNTDGTQLVTLTASASGLTTGTTNVYVYDNDVHHFGFSTIPSTQTTGVPFNVSLTAQDVNNNVISVFTGTASLSGAGDGGAVVVAPVATGNFSSGYWTGSVACNTARTNVRLTAVSGTVSSMSNAFNVVQAPAVSIIPASLSLALNQGDSTTRTMTIGNTGGGTLNWVIATSATLAEVVNESPVFSGNERADQNKDAAGTPPPSVPPEQVYVQERAPAGNALESAGSLSLQAVLNNLNANSGLVRGTIPSRYAFSEGVTGTSIGDGGGDMYDGGNYINTNLGNSLSYSDNIIASSALLGTGGQYFTRKYDGLWVLAADVNSIITFDITGNLGADGGGLTDTAVLSVTRDGVTYRGFVKRVYNSGDPSVNHLIIVADNGSVTHAAATDTNDDYHRLANLSGVTRIYYMLYAGTGGAYIDNTATLNIMTTFLDAISVPDWISPSANSGSIAAGTSQNVTLTISAASLSQGTYNRTLVVNSNDPFQPQATMPVSLNVLGVANLGVSPSTGLSSAGLRGGPFTPASQVFTVTNIGAQPLTWSAAKTAAWLDVSSSGGTLAAGASASVTASLNPGATSLTSGSYTDSLVFTNTTNGVGTTSRPVALNIAAFGELTVAPTLDLDASGPFGGPFIPGSQTYTLTNVGDAPLNWTATKIAPWLTLSSAGGTLAPASSTTVTATITAASLEPGTYTDTVSFTNETNARGNTTRSARLSVVLPTPSLAAEPPITPATSNTVTWTTVAGAEAYEVQCSSDSAFSSPVSSVGSIPQAIPLPD